MNIAAFVRPNILALKPYSCARDEFKGEAKAFLDANENPFGAPYNRYPDPRQTALKEKIARLKHVRPTQIMLGNGSDEPIDLTYRIFCEPGKDNAVGIAPSYGMYSVCADINNVEYREVPLEENFELNARKVLAATDCNTKVIWCCSPNNPSGNLLNRNELRVLLNEFNGMVVIDEAYIDFASEASWLGELDNYPNLIVLQTFSKAWAMASVRCGMAFASEEVLEYYNKVKYPYNINLLTQEFVSKRLDEVAETRSRIDILLQERTKLIVSLQQLPCTRKVYPTDANFVLVEVTDANGIYKKLVEEAIVVRNRHTVLKCGNCLRITVGTPEENKLLIESLRTMA
ncbi:MAG: histidinol-phosphate transaminase [Paludibacteraceae bacterium]|nr:histidinol-phosphate transaminase [Paludibacteraceae bacterium]